MSMNNTILIIDDQSVNASTLAEVLADEYEIQFATSGAKGLIIACGTPKPDLILLDVMMPDLDGYEVCWQLKTDERTRDIPVIFVTAQGEMADEAKGFAMGAVDFVTKPIQPQVVQARIRNHLAIKRAHDKIQLLMKSVNDGILVIDGESWIILDANPMIGTMLGHAPFDLIGRQWLDLFALEQQPLYRRLIESQLAADRSLLPDLRLACRNGGLLPVDMSVALASMGGQRLIYAIVRDISERQRNEEKNARVQAARIAIGQLLQAALEPTTLDEFLESALDAIHSVYWLSLQRRSAIFLLHKEQQELLLIKRYPADAMIPCTRVPVGVCLCGQAAASRKILFKGCMDEDHFIRHNRHVPSHGHYCIPIIFRDHLLGVLNLYTDEGHHYSHEVEGFLVTAANAMAMVLDRRELHRNLVRAKDAADAANQAKSDFLASMSHDIRTPMNAIVGMGDILLETALDDEQRGYVVTINRAAVFLLALVNDLLDLSKIEAGQLELEQIDFNLPEMVADTVAMLRVQATGKELTLTNNIDPGTPTWVKGDPGRLRQILLNLIGNALKFTIQGGVTVAVAVEGKMIRFDVADTGIGIPASRLKAIFQPFVQVDSTTSRRFGGSGLGLSICDKLVQRMNGRIEVDSTVGQGSVFHFSVSLPTVVSPHAASDDRTVAQGSTGLTILAADDSEDTRLLLQAFLKNSGHALHFVENGLAAVTRFQAGSFDLILMDMAMPDLDGAETIQRIRMIEQQDGRQPVPIIAITGHTMKEQIERLFQAGCNIYLAKPFNKKTLLDAIVRVMARSNDDKTTVSA